MTQAKLIAAAAMLPPVSGLVRRLGIGFCYWLVFVLVLEPDNVLKAESAFRTISWSQEAIRITAAAALGALSAPILLVLTDRFPIEGPRWLQRVGIHVLGTGVTAAVLVAVSCLLADWFLASERRSLAVALPQEFQANWTLLCFAIAGFVAGAHAVRFAGGSPALTAGGTRDFVTRLAVKTRGRIAFVDLVQVDWIEAQGNYVALHAGPETHLVRQSLSSLERQLDPDHFIRIHRRTIVSIDRVRALISLGAGDALVRLTNGTELRMSRAYRERVTEHIRGCVQPSA